MKPDAPREAKATIRFDTEWTTLKPAEAGPGKLLRLPDDVNTQLPSQVQTEVEGTINGLPFRASLERNESGRRALKMPRAVLEALGANISSGSVEITRVGDEPELREPVELSSALTSSPSAQETWAATTPLARRDWILWIISGKEADTRRIRIEKACAMLAAGKRRVCCFGGLNWLTKSYAQPGGTWLPLPKNPGK